MTREPNGNLVSPRKYITVAFTAFPMVNARGRPARVFHGPISSATRRHSSANCSGDMLAMAVATAVVTAKAARMASGQTRHCPVALDARLEVLAPSPARRLARRSGRLTWSDHHAHLSGVG